MRVDLSSCWTVELESLVEGVCAGVLLIFPKLSQLKGDDFIESKRIIVTGMIIDSAIIDTGSRVSLIYPKIWSSVGNWAV